MTSEDLIAEGRGIQRPTVLLTPEETGDIAAVWYGGKRREESDDGYRCWLSVNGAYVPSCKLAGWLSIFTNDETCEGGRVQVTQTMPLSKGLQLCARAITVLPPIDAVIARGSPAVDRWLAENDWDRHSRYNANFRDRAIVEVYEAVEQRENPLYRKGSYAALGGWHMGWPDDDWHELIDETLLVQTFMDSEPWVEAWQLRSGLLKVIQRIT